MKNIVDFPDRNAIEQEAAEWLVRLDADTAPSEQDLCSLKEWMGRSVLHAETLEKLNSLWGNLVLTELYIPQGKPIPQGGAPANAQNNTQSTCQRGAVSAHSFLSGKSWAIAAGLLCISVLIAQMLVPSWLVAESFDQTNGTYVTAIGKQNSVSLDDGSVVYLNTNSQISVEFNQNFRDITLISGEAHFDVAKMKGQPFRVYAGQGRVQAVGTAFSVYLRGGDVDVLVTEGEVALAAQDFLPPIPPDSPGIESNAPNAVLSNEVHSDGPEYDKSASVHELGPLKAGQGATITIRNPGERSGSQKGREVKLMDVNTLTRRDAWRDGLLLFTGDSLEDVVAEIRRYTDISIEISEPALKKVRIGGQFSLSDLNGMFDMLEANFGLNIIRLDSNHVQIHSAENSSKLN